MKGLLVEKGNEYDILLMPDGGYKRVWGRTEKQIGMEVEVALTRPTRTYAAATAALLIILILVQTVILPLQRVAGYVTLDINPSIEFAINRKDQVLKAHPFNEEAAQILEQISYRRRVVEDVLEDFTRQAISLHYIEPGKENRVVISLVSKGRSQSVMGAEKLSHIKEAQQKVLRETGQTGVVRTEVFGLKVREEARQQGVSAVKLKEVKDKQNKVRQENKKDEVREKEAEKPGKNLEKSKKNEAGESRGISNKPPNHR